MVTFEETIQMEKVTERTKSLIETLNNSSVAGSAIIMVVLNAFPISDTNEILAKIQFSVNNNKVVFGVITPTMEYLSAFASRFNMASSMNCTIRYRLIGECLNVKFKPPDEREEVLRDFFELTEKSN